MAERRKLPTPYMGMAMFSSPVSFSSSMRLGGTTSINRFITASGGITWLLIGMHWPLILMVAGACADRYTSDAFFSAIRCRMRSIMLVGAGTEVAMVLRGAIKIVSACAAWSSAGGLF